MVQAWYCDSHIDIHNKSLPNVSAKGTVCITTLKKLGVLSWHIPTDNLDHLNKIAEERQYTSRDEVWLLFIGLLSCFGGYLLLVVIG
jgi:hypothetical protein